VSKWFNLITSQSFSTALGKIEGEEKLQKIFDLNIQFLESVIELFRNIKIGQDRNFKPVQCGIMITTTSLIQLTNYLINKWRY